MQDLVTKIGRFCENHVEKIVLALVGLVCAWLFFTRVIFSPVVVMMDGKRYTPGQIDRRILDEKVPELKTASRQDIKAVAARAYKSPLTGNIDANDPLITGLFDRPLPGGFAKLFDSPLAFIAREVHFTKPAPLAHEKMHAGRKYRLPVIPDVTEVGANYLRAAAYVPLEEVTPKTTYDKAKVEPNDIDLVTVEAKFDAAELYRRFEASFNGVDVQQEGWRDPCLATPVFAAVQLERQELRADGTLSPWQAVPRARIEPHRTLFQVFEKVEDLPPGGLDVRLMQFREKSITMELLQPEAYQIASAEEDWFPPSYYDKFKTLQRRVEMDERRKQKEDRDKEKNTDNRRGGDTAMGRGGMGGRSGMAAGRSPTGGQPGGSQYTRVPGSRNTRGTGRADQGLNPQLGGKNRPNRRGPGGAADQMYPEMYGMTGAETGRRKASTNEAYLDFADALISYTTDLAQLEKPVLFWVFDDTVEPGKTYQYRVRLGVFNPVAGTAQLVDRDMDKKDQAILWSSYSEVTKPMEIRDRLYLFAREVQSQTRTATVEVARYNLGYWHSEDFQVKLGESIGKEVEPKEEKRPLSRLAQGDRITDMRGPGGMPDPRGMGMGGMGPGGMDYMMGAPDRALKPEKIDYTTGKVLVDLVEISDWGGAPNLHPRKYHDMLYTGDGTTIEHMPASVSSWPKDLVATYQFIQSETRREPQPFRAFNKGGLQGRGRRGMMPGGPGYEDMGGGAYDDMGMYDMGPGMGPYNR